jgi:hypothetical protein
VKGVRGGRFNTTVNLNAGPNTIQVKAARAATLTAEGNSGTLNVTLDNTPPTLTIALSDPVNAINITVSASERLVNAPEVTVQKQGYATTTTVVMTQSRPDVGRILWAARAETITEGNYTVTARLDNVATTNR